MPDHPLDQERDRVVSLANFRDRAQAKKDRGEPLDENEKHVLGELPTFAEAKASSYEMPRGDLNDRKMRGEKLDPRKDAKPMNGSARRAQKKVSEPRPFTAAEILTQWQAAGALVHEPTGIRRLDELTGGGPVYGTRWYVSGAPDAGKTALLVQIANVYLDAGVTVGLHSADEEADDVVQRFAQRHGYSRRDCEIRDPGVLAGMQRVLEPLPLLIYDERWTIESAAADLAAHARKRADDVRAPRAMLGIDSLQMVTCDLEALRKASGKELPTSEAVTARTRAIRTVAKTHGLIVIATSELNRGAYATGDQEKQTKTLAASKWSSSVEYAARVLLGLRSVAGEKDLLDLEIAKNKHGPKDDHVYLRIDRASQWLSETSYEPPPEADQDAQREERKRGQVTTDSETVLRLIVAQPGIATRDLISAAAGEGLSRARVYAAVHALGDRIERRDGKRDAKHHFPRPDA